MKQKNSERRSCGHLRSERPSNIVGDCGVLERPLSDPGECSIEVGEEALGESGPLTGLLSRDRLDISGIERAMALFT